MVLVGQFYSGDRTSHPILGIGWLVLEVTGSATELGLVIFLYGVPNVAFLLVAGIVADRFDRRHVLMLTQTGVGFLIATLGILELFDAVAIWNIYIAAFVLGIVQSLNMPARTTMVSDIVAKVLYWTLSLCKMLRFTLAG
ncbi:MAG: hypothetical protein CM1200mP22_10550 [Dehalococcoidia bacterium]|nr:MAG: hypothetical protein CM1200mP22_10550 [Dehalococcoidia bacterium]